MQNYYILLLKTITSKYYIYNCSEQNAPTLQYIVAFLGKPAFSNPKKNVFSKHSISLPLF